MSRREYPEEQRERQGLIKMPISFKEFSKEPTKAILFISLIAV